MLSNCESLEGYPDMGVKSNGSLNNPEFSAAVWANTEHGKALLEAAIAEYDAKHGGQVDEVEPEFSPSLG